MFFFCRQSLFRLLLAKSEERGKEKHKRHGGVVFGRLELRQVYSHVRAHSTLHGS